MSDFTGGDIVLASVGIDVKPFIQALQRMNIDFGDFKSKLNKQGSPSIGLDTSGAMESIAQLQKSIKKMEKMVSGLSDVTIKETGLKQLVDNINKINTDNLNNLITSMNELFERGTKYGDGFRSFVSNIDAAANAINWSQTRNNQGDTAFRIVGQQVKEASDKLESFPESIKNAASNINQFLNRNIQIRTLADLMDYMDTISGRMSDLFNVDLHENGSYIDRIAKGIENLSVLFSNIPSSAQQAKTGIQNAFKQVDIDVIQQQLKSISIIDDQFIVEQMADVVKRVIDTARIGVQKLGSIIGNTDKYFDYQKIINDIQKYKQDLYNQSWYSTGDPDKYHNILWESIDDVKDYFERIRSVMNEYGTGDIKFVDNIIEQLDDLKQRAFDVDEYKQLLDSSISSISEKIGMSSQRIWKNLGLKGGSDYQIGYRDLKQATAKPLSDLVNQYIMVGKAQQQVGEKSSPMVEQIKSGIDQANTTLDDFYRKIQMLETQLDDFKTGSDVQSFFSQTYKSLNKISEFNTDFLNQMANNINSLFSTDSKRDVSYIDRIVEGLSGISGLTNNMSSLAESFVHIGASLGLMRSQDIPGIAIQLQKVNGLLTNISNKNFQTMINNSFHVGGSAAQQQKEKLRAIRDQVLANIKYAEKLYDLWNNADGNILLQIQSKEQINAQRVEMYKQLSSFSNEGTFKSIANKVATAGVTNLDQYRQFAVSVQQIFRPIIEQMNQLGAGIQMPSDSSVIKAAGALQQVQKNSRNAREQVDSLKQMMDKAMGSSTKIDPSFFNDFFAQFENTMSRVVEQIQTRFSTIGQNFNASFNFSDDINNKIGLISQNVEKLIGVIDNINVQLNNIWTNIESKGNIFQPQILQLEEIKKLISSISDNFGGFIITNEQIENIVQSLSGLKASIPDESIRSIIDSISNDLGVFNAKTIQVVGNIDNATSSINRINDSIGSMSSLFENMITKQGFGVALSTILESFEGLQSVLNEINESIKSITSGTVQLKGSLKSAQSGSSSYQNHIAEITSRITTMKQAIKDMKGMKVFDSSIFGNAQGRFENAYTAIENMMNSKPKSDWTKQQIVAFGQLQTLFDRYMSQWNRLNQMRIDGAKQVVQEQSKVQQPTDYTSAGSGVYEHRSKAQDQLAKKQEELANRQVALNQMMSSSDQQRVKRRLELMEQISQAQTEQQRVTAQKQASDDIASKILAKQQEINKAVGQYNYMMATSAASAENIRLAEQKVAEQVQNLVDLRRQLNDLQERKSAFDSKISGLNEQLMAAQKIAAEYKRIAEIDQQIKTLRKKKPQGYGTQIFNLTAQKENIEKFLAGLKQPIETTINRIKEQIQKLMTDNPDLAGSNVFDDIKRKIDMAYESLNKWIAIRDQAVNNSNNLFSDQDIQSAKEKIESLKAQLQTLIDEQSKMSGFAGAAEVENAAKKLADLQKQLADLEQMTRVDSNGVSYLSTDDIEKAKAGIISLQTQIENLRQSINGMNDQASGSSLRYIKTISQNHDEDGNVITRTIEGWNEAKRKVIEYQQAVYGLDANGDVDFSNFLGWQKTGTKEFDDAVDKIHIFYEKLLAYDKAVAKYGQKSQQARAADEAVRAVKKQVDAIDAAIKATEEYQSAWRHAFGVYEESVKVVDANAVQKHYDDLLKKEENYQERLIKVRAKIGSNNLTYTGNTAAKAQQARIMSQIAKTRNQIDMYEKVGLTNDNLKIKLQQKINRLVADQGMQTKNSIGIGDKLLSQLTSMLRMYVGIHALRRMWSSAKSYAMEYYDAINEIRMVTGMTQEQADALVEKYQEMAVELSASSTDIAKAAVTYYRQGLDTSDVNERLIATTKYAKIAGIEFDTAADIMTAAMNTLGKSSGMTAEQISDVFILLGKQNCPQAA